jgi:hypothetical protein
MRRLPADFLAGAFLAGTLLSTAGPASSCPLDCSSRGLFTSGSLQMEPSWGAASICRTGPFPWQSRYCDVAYVTAEPYQVRGGDGFAPAHRRAIPAAARADRIARHVDAAPRRAAGATMRESACKQYPNLC